jgi:ElaB/YqjD/DUF883 family membrane-anchored ribosome-binding protein
MANALVDEIAEDLNKSVKRAFTRLAEGAESASHLAHDFAHDAGSKTRRGAEAVRREVRDHPMTSVAFGLAAGALATLLLTSLGARRTH